MREKEKHSMTVCGPVFLINVAALFFRVTFGMFEKLLSVHQAQNNKNVFKPQVAMRATV